MLQNLKAGLLRSRAALVRSVRNGACYVAVTGSSGKTTTTQLIGEVLSQAAPVKAFSGYNSLKHVVENISSISRDIRFVVQEVHGGEPGLARQAAQIIRPNVAVITVIGLEHQNSFASKFEVAAAKSDLVAALPKDGIAVLNADDPLVVAMAQRTNARVVTYGTGSDAYLRCVGTRMRFPDGLCMEVEFAGRSYVIQTNLIGKQWVTSVLAAFLTGLELGVAPDLCVRALSTYSSPDGRCSLHPFLSGSFIVNDSYKAPEWSIRLFLDLIASIEAPRKTIVLGEISDSKQKKGKRLRGIAQESARVCDRVVFVGSDAAQSLVERGNSSLGRKLTIVPDVRSAYDYLANDPVPGELIFLKSSRSMHLDRIVRNHESPIDCWREYCGRKIDCLECKLLRV